MAIPLAEQESFRFSARKAYELSQQLGIETNLLIFAEPEILNYAGKFDEFIDWALGDLPPSFFSAPCFMPFYHIVVDHRGLVHPCWNHRNPLEESVFEKPLGEIFFGPHFTQARQSFLRKEAPAFCANCCTEHILNTHMLRMELLLACERYDDLLRLRELDSESFSFRRMRFAALVGFELEKQKKEGRETADESFILGELTDLIKDADAQQYPFHGLISLLYPLHALGAYRAVLKLSDEITAHEGDNAQVLWCKAAAGEKLGERDFSLQLLERAAAFAARPDLQAAIQDTKASIFSRLGRFDEALAAAVKALEIEPERIEARLIAAYAHYKSARKSEARRMLEPLLAKGIEQAKKFHGNIDRPPSRQAPRIKPSIWTEEVKIGCDFLLPSDRWLLQE
jgi:tetratricopeptide (TPR) repeat protein